MKMLLSISLACSIGCGGGGGDDDDQPPSDGQPPAIAVERRSVSSFSAVNPVTQLSFAGDAAIQPGDVVIAMIHAKSVDAIAMTANPGWTPLADDLAVMCTGSFHTWFLTTTASATTTFDFTFDVQDTFTAIVTAYKNAGSAELMSFKKMGELRNMQIIYDAATLAPGSVVWMGGGAQTNWTDLDAPVGTTLVNATDNAAVYEVIVTDGNAPAIELPNDNGFCANVAQLSVEP